MCCVRREYHDCIVMISADDVRQGLPHPAFRLVRVDVRPDLKVSLYARTELLEIAPSSDDRDAGIAGRGGCQRYGHLRSTLRTQESPTLRGRHGTASL